MIEQKNAPCCEEFEKWIKVIDDYIALQAVRMGGKGYEGPKFKFCPWCGKEIEEDRPQVIVCAAIKSGSGLIACGARHFDDFMRMQIERSGGTRKNLPEETVRLTDEWTVRGEEGFIDNQGNFLTREEAWIIAEENGQIKYRCGGDENGVLYSENLY